MNFSSPWKEFLPSNRFSLFLQSRLLIAFCSILQTCKNFFNLQSIWNNLNHLKAIERCVGFYGFCGQEWNSIRRPCCCCSGLQCFNANYCQNCDLNRYCCCSCCFAVRTQLPILLFVKWHLNRKFTMNDNLANCALYTPSIIYFKVNLPQELHNKSWLLSSSPTILPLMIINSGSRSEYLQEEPETIGKSWPFVAGKVLKFPKLPLLNLPESTGVAFLDFSLIIYYI